MAGTPDVSIVTKYVFEDPWAPAIGLGLIAGVMAWTALREGLPKRLLAASVPGVLAVVLVLCGMVVATAGETAEAVVRSFVEEVTRRDLRAARRMTSTTCIANSRDVNAIGLPMDAAWPEIRKQLDRASIESITITSLDAYTVSDRRGDVQFTCRTMIPTGMTLTTWMIRVEREAGDVWRITRITLLRLFDDAAPSIESLL